MKDYAYDTYKDVTHFKKNYEKVHDVNNPVPSRYLSNYNEFLKVTELHPSQ
jgi:hypothetical protein